MGKYDEANEKHRFFKEKLSLADYFGWYKTHKEKPKHIPNYKTEEERVEYSFYQWLLRNKDKEEVFKTAFDKCFGKGKYDKENKDKKFFVFQKYKKK